MKTYCHILRSTNTIVIILFVTLGILNCNNVFSQSAANTIYSVQHTQPNTARMREIFTPNNNYIYITRFVGGFTNNTLLEKYDQSFKLINQAEYISKESNIDFRFTFPFNDSIYALGTSYSKETKKQETYYTQINTNTLKLSAPVLIRSDTIGETDKKEKIVDYIVSKNGEYLAFFGLPYQQGRLDYFNSTSRQVLNGYDKNQHKAGNILLLNSGMNKLWQKDFLLPFSANESLPQDIALDDSGNVYLLSYGKDSLYDKNSNSNLTDDLIISIFKNDGINEKLTKIDVVEGKYIIQCQIGITLKNEIICVGYYLDDDNLKPSGIFAMCIDPETGNVLKESYYPLSEVEGKFFLWGFNHKRRAFISMEKLLIRPDGSINFMCEKYFESNRNFGEAKPPEMDYFYSDILVVNITKEYNINWITTIPKYQHSDSRLALSYGSFLKDDKLFLFINDNEKNLTENYPEKDYGCFEREFYPTLVEINSIGAWKKTRIYRDPPSDVTFIPVYTTKFNKNEVLLYSEKRQTYVISRTIIK